MKSSTEMNEIAKALAKAQLEMSAASKSSTNPHFKSKYAALPEVMEVAKVLNKHGLAYVQPTRSENGSVTVETVLIHGESGQWLSGELTLVPQQNTPQGVGSAVTYGRRFSLCSLVGIVADEDDDGNAASSRPPTRQVHTDDTLTEKLQASVKKNGNGASSPRAVEGPTVVHPPPTADPATVGPSGRPQVDPQEQTAADLIAVCEAGFKSKDHKLNWFRKHVEEINKLGKPWAQEVVTAYHKAAE